MKKIIFIIICMFISINVLQAECLDQEILKWSRDAQVGFETSDNIENADYLYYLFLDPARDDVEIISTNSLYAGETKGSLMENGKYGIPSYIHFEEKTYTIEVFMKKNAKSCAGEQVLKLRYTVPPYNSYSRTRYCELYPKAELCKKMLDTEDITQDEFVEKMEEYASGNKYKEKEKKDNLLKIIIFDYLIWILLPAVIIGTIFKFKINKVRRENDEK